MIIDLSLSNEKLYKGCQIETVAGRATLITAPADAINIIGKNLETMIALAGNDDRSAVTLTGPMAVWAYLVVFKFVANRFSSVVYDDGRGAPLLVSAK